MQAWPRECICLQSIADVNIETQPSIVCCVPNTVKTVRLQLSDHPDPMQLVGILDPKQFIEDVLAIQTGAQQTAATRCVGSSRLQSRPKRVRKM